MDRVEHTKNRTDFWEYTDYCHIHEIKLTTKYYHDTATNFCQWIQRQTVITQLDVIQYYFTNSVWSEERDHYLPSLPSSLISVSSPLISFLPTQGFCPPASWPSCRAWRSAMSFTMGSVTKLRHSPILLDIFCGEM